MIGKIIDDFTIVNSIGSGGMGNVYIAFQRSLERQIALKVIDKSEIADSATVVERFIREAKIAASIQHPNIINVFSVGEDKDLFYIAMEYVPGKTLENLISDDELVDELRAWEIALQICEGLKNALEIGVIHRDIKPGNILLNTKGLVKITDFGISKKLDESSSLTHSGTILGTPDYMSPEQASAGEIDYRSDIYSLGATIYHLLTKMPLFCGSSIIDILIQHKSAKVIPLQVHRESLSLNTSAIIGKMLAKSKNDRYQNYDEIIEDINCVIDNKPLKFAMFPNCFDIYTFPPQGKRKKLVGRISQRISSWITGEQLDTSNVPSKNSQSERKTVRLVETQKKIDKQERTKKTRKLEQDKNITFDSEEKTQTDNITETSDSKTKITSNSKSNNFANTTDNKAKVPLDVEDQQQKQNQSSLQELHQINTVELIEKASEVLNKDKKTHKNSCKEREEVVKKIKDIMIEMAEDVDELLFVSVIGMDGIPIAQHGKSEVNIDSFAAKFTMVMKLIYKSVSGLQKIGALEENLVQAEDAWVLTRFLGKNYFLCIAASRDGILGNVRVASQKYAGALQDSLGV